MIPSTPLRFALDTNCLIDLEERRPGACFIDELVTAHRRGIVHVCVLAISASERRREGASAKSFLEFKGKLENIGLDTVEMLKPIGYWDLTFWDYCLWGDPNDTLEKSIHDVLFSEVTFRGQPDETKSARWRNAKCDVLGMWSHIHYQCDVFVTSDGNFHKATKKPRLIELGAKAIVTPEEGVAMLG